MRLLYIAVLALGAMVGAARAQPYDNPKYGYSINVSTAISDGWEEADAGDGLRSHSADGDAEFLIYGGFLLDENGAKVKFSTEIKGRIKIEEGGGGKVSYRKLDGNKAAAYAGTMGSRIFYVRAIAACKGGSIASYRLEYPAARKVEFDSVIKALNDSFIDDGGCELKN